MIVSVNWLKKYTTIDMPVRELAKLIGARLVEIEDVIDLGARYKGVVVARVEKVYKHPNADKLNVVEIDDGGAGSYVDRLDNGRIQVVCGAKNVREGLFVAWIMPGATVPATYGDAEPFHLEARLLRGVMSNGMLASGKELAINSDHEGIAELDDSYTPGTMFADALELDDYLLDIENKSLTHRPDCFGLIGFAREVAAILGKPFKSPDWLLTLEPQLADVVSVEGIAEPRVTIDDPALCPRYEAVVIAGIDSKKQSPLVIQSYLKRVGVRPISAVVDVTNYLMVTTGHPLHAFDYDAFLRVQNDGDVPHVKVRSARDGEKLTLLDGRTVSLTQGDILICAGETPVGLAGAMGGAETEVTDDTKNILLEAATFNLYNLRNTSMRHGIFSDAVTRFTKGQPAEQTAPVLASAARMLSDIAGGVRASEIIDEHPVKEDDSAITVSLSQINQTLGADFSLKDIKQTLINIECTVTPGDNDELLVLPPYWRADLHIAEDIIEEIGRINGFDSLDPTLPTRPYRAVTPQPFELFKSSVRSSLVRMGANEVLTYSFIHGNILESARQNITDAYKIVNAISPELQYYRTSLTPSLLDKVNGNIRQGYDQFALFELNKVHAKESLDKKDEDLPKEHYRLGFVISANDKTAASSYEGAAYYQAKYYVAELLRQCHIEHVLRPLSDAAQDLQEPIMQALAAPYEAKRSALIVSSNGTILGVVGEFKKSVSQKFKLPAWCAGFELMLDEAFVSAAKGARYSPLSRFPGTEQDICFKVRRDVTYQQILEIVHEQLKNQPYESDVQPVDIYQKTKEDDFKQVTIRVSLNNHEATIVSEQANAVIEAIASAAKEQLEAERV
jgi:phenylalanyl-tRNA synthetase beta chain